MPQPKVALLRRSAVLIGVVCAAASIIGYANRDTLGAAVLALTSATCSVVWWRSHYISGLVPISNTLGFGVWICIMGLSGFGGGGIDAPAAGILPAIPLLVALTAGRQSAVVWTVVCALTAASLAFMGGEEALARFPSESLHPLRAASFFAQTLFITFVTLSFLYLTEQQLDELERSQDAALAAHTEAKAARALAESASVSKSTFLSTMSHEFRTPLTALIGAKELLGESTDATVQQHRALIEASSETLRAVIDDILDLAQIESKALGLNAVPVDLYDLSMGVGAMLANAPQAKNLDFSNRQVGPRFVVADPIRLRQVAANLGGNALKYTDNGAVDILWESRALPGERVAVTLTVRDTGIGIDSANFDVIFEAFEQVENHRGRPSRGVGLGLRIVRELVEPMGGVISVESTLGEGSTFTVDLEFPAATPISTDAPAVQKTYELQVLLAEDEPVNQVIIRLMLERMGCRVEVASNGEEAIAMATVKDAAFDLLLMDCRMPVLGGIEAAEHLRAKEVTTPIVALTANTTADDRNLCLAAGMDDFVSKPLTLALLEGVLDRAARGALGSR